MKETKHKRQTCVRSVSTNSCRQEENNRFELCSGDRWWKRSIVEGCGKCWERTIFAWEYFLQERSRVKRFRELADEEKQAGIQGQWQQESPAREHLEQVECCHDTDCNEPMMKKGFTALKNGTREESMKRPSRKDESLGMGL